MVSHFQRCDSVYRISAKYIWSLFVHLEIFRRYCIGHCLCWWYSNYWWWFVECSKNSRYLNKYLLNKRPWRSIILFRSWSTSHLKRIIMNQHKYVSEIIEKAHLQHSATVRTPMEVNLKLTKENGDLLPNPEMYWSIFGNLVYLIVIRPDISFAVHQVSQFMHAPRHLHLAAVHRIIRYLKGTSTRGLFFSSENDLRLLAYADADWTGCVDTMKSTSCWCVFLGQAFLSWKCKKQDRVSKSTTKAEYWVMFGWEGFLQNWDVHTHLLHLFMQIT